ncbi:MAG: NUDIX hydrolase [Chloroflexota bacterium]
MDRANDFRWLEWAQRLAAASQNGLTYAENPFDRDRYRAIQRVVAEIFAEYATADFGRIETLLQGEIGYATPKVDVRAVVFRDDRVLLVRERDDGRWSLPGGWADVSDAPSEAVVREVFEESGFRTEATKLLAVYDRTKQGHPPMPFHAYKLFFQCDLIGGVATGSTETDGVEFFAEDNLPELSLGRVTRNQIHRFFQHRVHPEWPTDFD